MLQFDLTLLVIWYGVPFALIGGRAALAGYRAWKKRNEVKRIQEKMTPFTREI